MRRTGYVGLLCLEGMSSPCSLMLRRLTSQAPLLPPFAFCPSGSIFKSSGHFNSGGIISALRSISSAITCGPASRSVRETHCNSGTVMASRTIHFGRHAPCRAVLPNRVMALSRVPQSFRPSLPSVTPTFLQFRNVQSEVRHIQEVPPIHIIVTYFLSASVWLLV